jgi:hypothetical protein
MSASLCDVCLSLSFGLTDQHWKRVRSPSISRGPFTESELLTRPSVVESLSLFSFLSVCLSLSRDFSHSTSQRRVPRDARFPSFSPLRFFCV